LQRLLDNEIQNRKDDVDAEENARIEAINAEKAARE
jgi:hypothetical protein